MTAVYQLNVYNVQENQGTAQICVVIISPTVTQLNGASSVTVTFQAGGSATGVYTSIIMHMNSYVY